MCLDESVTWRYRADTRCPKNTENMQMDIVYLRGLEMKVIVVIIVSAIVATVGSKILNRNTIGTQGAYMRRWLTIFFVTAFLLMMAG